MERVLNYEQSFNFSRDSSGFQDYFRGGLRFLIIAYFRSYTCKKK